MSDAPTGQRVQREPSEPAAPPLSLLCAAGALLGLAVKQVIVPAFAKQGAVSQWLRVERWGDFFTLVAAVAGCIALPYAVLPLARADNVASSRRVTIAGLTAVVIYVVARAAFCERIYTSSQEVFLGLGAAHLLGLSLAVGAFPRCRQLVMRIALAAAAIMAAAGLAGHLMDLVGRTGLVDWQLQLGRIVHGLGEVSYITTLGALTVAIGTRPLDPRQRLLHFAMFLLLGMFATAYVLLANHLGDAFKLVLYNAQRVRLWIEWAPLLYGVPICAGLAAGLAGLLAKEGHRRQWAIALLLLLATGYSPRAPAKLLTFALSLSLLARGAGRRRS